MSARSQRWKRRGASARQRQTRSAHHAPETLVVIVGVIALPVAPGDDPSRATIGRTGGDHGVLAVVAIGLCGQQPLAVAEGDPVAIIRERAAAIDQRDRLLRLGGSDAKGTVVKPSFAAGAALGAREGEVAVGVGLFAATVGATVAVGTVRLVGVRAGVVAPIAPTVTVAPGAAALAVTSGVGIPVVAAGGAPSLAWLKTMPAMTTISAPSAPRKETSRRDDPACMKMPLFRPLAPHRRPAARRRAESIAAAWRYHLPASGAAEGRCDAATTPARLLSTARTVDGMEPRKYAHRKDADLRSAVAGRDPPCDRHSRRRSRPPRSWPRSTPPTGRRPVSEASSQAVGGGADMRVVGPELALRQGLRAPQQHRRGADLYRDDAPHGPPPGARLTIIQAVSMVS